MLRTDRRNWRFIYIEDNTQNNPYLLTFEYMARSLQLLERFLQIGPVVCHGGARQDSSKKETSRHKDAPL